MTRHTLLTTTALAALAVAAAMPASAAERVIALPFYFTEPALHLVAAEVPTPARTDAHGPLHYATEPGPHHGTQPAVATRAGGARVAAASFHGETEFASPAPPTPAVTVAAAPGPVETHDGPTPACCSCVDPY